MLLPFNCLKKPVYVLHLDSVKVQHMDAVTVDLSKSRRISSIKSSQQRMTGGTVSSFNANPAFIMRPWLILLNGDAGRPMMAHG